MAFSNSIQFTLGQGGLNTPQPGSDYVSGIIFVSTTTPSGFTWSVAKEIFSITDAQNLGIIGDYSDETAAISRITISSTGSSGNTIAISVVEPDINNTTTTTSIGTYTVQTTDVTLNGLANNLSSFINTKYGASGYLASTPVGASFSLTARTGLGTIINGTTPTITDSVGTTASAAAFSGGVNSTRIEEWYQISEFFRQNPNGVLWVQYETSYNTFNCINNLQTQAGNSIRQTGLYNVGASASATVTANLDTIQSVCTTMFNNYSPMSVIYAPNIYGVIDLATLPNLRTRSDNYLSCVIGQDGGGLGAHLSKMYGKAIPSYGAVLGAVSFAKVSEDIGWVQKFNLSNGVELEIPAISNNYNGLGLYSYLYANYFNLLSQLDAYGYIFNMKRPNISGTWVNDSHCAIVSTSDYAYIERNRTIDKVVRNMYLSLAPLIMGPLVINTDGTLAYTSINTIKSAATPSMNAMIQNGEISNFSIIVDPRQNVLNTSTVAVSLNIIPIGIARSIQIVLGFVTSL